MEGSHGFSLSENRIAARRLADRVPHRPRGLFRESRPVLCSFCFEGQGARDRQRAGTAAAAAPTAIPRTTAVTKTCRARARAILAKYILVNDDLLFFHY